MNREKKFELLGILIYYIFSSLLIAFFKLGYLSGAIIYLAIPAIYITYKKKSIFKKAFLFSVILPLPIVLVFDYILTVSRAWIEVTSSGLRVLGVVSLESFIWSFLVTYFTISFYKYFFDTARSNVLFSKNIKYLCFFLLVLVAVFGIIYVIDRNLLIINYSYAYFSILFFVFPPTVILIKRPVLMKKVVYQGLYFLLLSIIYEITALYAGHWIFPGNYIGFIEIIGFRFPLEELLWLAFCVPSTLAIYEVFADDEK